ncbi:MAG: type II secretion system protein [Halieaceae bacterium]
MLPQCLHPSGKTLQGGFSLVEVAIVMVIIGALLGGLVIPLATQQDASKRRETNQLLQDVHDALMGFAAANGRLPCPATAASAGLASPNNATAACTTYNGFVPARTLGVAGPVDGNNRLIDRWLNPIRYSLSSAGGGGYSNGITLGLAPDLQICPNAACLTPIADTVVAVVFAQAADTNGSPDQLENTDGDTRFVQRNLSEAVGAEFDDELRWISPNSLTYQLVRAGQLN